VMVSLGIAGIVPPGGVRLQLLGGHHHPVRFILTTAVPHWRDAGYARAASRRRPARLPL
jgi:hypothetical protein